MITILLNPIIELHLIFNFSEVFGKKYVFSTQDLFDSHTSTHVWLLVSLPGHFLPILLLVHAHVLLLP